MALDDLFTNGQPDACARVLVAGVQALKHLKDTFVVLGIYADAVIAHGKNPIVLVALGRDVDLGGVVLGLEFDGVADQVLKDLDQLWFVGH